jgi:hypothetical protein
VPSSVLLFTTGSPIGAVADILNVEMLPSRDGTEPTVSFTLDVVRKPDTISKLKQHPKQTLDDDAHHHFYTPDGVTVDADRFLTLLKTSTGRLTGEGELGLGFYGCRYK